MRVSRTSHLSALLRATAAARPASSAAAAAPPHRYRRLCAAPGWAGASPLSSKVCSCRNTCVRHKRTVLILCVLSGVPVSSAVVVRCCALTQCSQLCHGRQQQPEPRHTPPATRYSVPKAHTPDEAEEDRVAEAAAVVRQVWDGWQALLVGSCCEVRRDEARADTRQ
jgi:hypothetical protein